jgi:polyphosphate kinase 2 (PPK2 family)
MAPSLDAVLKRSRKLARRYLVTDGSKFRLADHDPKDTGDFTKADRPKAEAALRDGVAALSTLQDMLYAQDKWAVLLVFQAMDAAGKDGAIKHVMSGVNPQGCQVASFKAPSPEELDHDYLWRCQRHLPERGRIGLFNRYVSHLYAIDLDGRRVDKILASRVAEVHRQASRGRS